MNWYLSFKISAGPQVSIDTSAYESSVNTRIQSLLDYQQQKQFNLRNFQPNLGNIQSVLTKYQYPNTQQLISALNSKNPEQMENVYYALSAFHKEISRKNGWNNSEDLWKVYRHIHDIIEHAQISSPEYQPYDMANAQQELLPMIEATKQNMQQIAQTVSEAISRIPQWNGSPVFVEASTADKDWDIFTHPMDYASIEFGVGENVSNPAFTYFTNDGKVEIDDVLEAGDDEFFTDPRVQADYFNLVKEIRSPGSTSRNGKTISLYTARPVRDRKTYLDAKQIPSNLFLTSNYNSAEGIAIDLAGGESQRDIWKVRIDSRYLIQTLDSPGEKHYQVVGDGFVPVVSMELISTGEA